VNSVDKARVRTAFSRRAQQYDAHATVQQHVVARAALLAAAEARSPRRVLDVGSGTGTLLQLLSQRLHRVPTVGLDLSHAMVRTARTRVRQARFLTGDAEALPFRDGAFDLVVSTSTLQWLPRLDEAVAETRRVLAPGGVFCLALFCRRTLYELRDAWRDALAGRGLAEQDRTHHFASAPDVGAALARAGLRVRRLSTEERVSRHPDVRAVLESLRAIGAGNAAPRAVAGLGGRQVVLEMMRLYTDRHGNGSGVPATYEICYAVASRE
jgi:malonyl-CoA O-methyltransferase